MDDTTLAKIENQRLELEENVAKLRKSLRHWQTLEIDYEGLKEEFQGLPESASQEECLDRAKDFKPELVDEKELRSLLRDQQRGYKRPSQLVELLSKRVDYVARNISTIRKQLSDSEKKRNALLLAQDPDHQDEAALPLSEITEELDSDGRVISSTVQNPGQNAPDLLDVLRKAGVPDVKQGSDPGVFMSGTSLKSTDSADLVTANHSDGTKSRNVISPIDEDRAKEVSDNEDADSVGDGVEATRLGPTNPEDSKEDATLRQEMLKYGLDEVGAIVAELDLQEPGNLSNDEDDPADYLSDYDEDEDLYTDESEDEKGATKNPVISERYRRQMEALSKKHGITDLENLGPEPVLPDGVREQLDRPPAAEAARKAAIARDEAVKSVLKTTDAEDKAIEEPRRKKKKVGFAPDLDIAQESSTSTTAAADEPAANTIADTIVERTSDSHPPPAAPLSIQPPSSKKMSRFKAARSAAPPTPMFPPAMDFPSPNTDDSTPEGPPGRTISDTLVERPASEITSEPTDPIDFDEALHRREVAVEYQKLRNRHVHEQGGYVRGGEAENYGDPLAPGTVVDEVTGKQRKVSRFKAARLQSSQSPSSTG